MSSKGRITFFAALILLLCGEFIKDFFMLNINHVLKHLQKGYADFAHPSFYFLEEWSINEIMILKWVLTIVFFFLFWGISLLVLRTYFAPKGQRVFVISYLYIGLITVAGILYVTGFVLGISETMYHSVRTITGITHSFLPTMMAFLYLQYFPKENA